MAFEAQFAAIEDKSCHILNCDWAAINISTLMLVLALSVVMLQVKLGWQPAYGF